MSRFIRPVLVAALALAPVSTVQAQDWRGTPVFGQVRLSEGFTPDPHTVNLTAGGPVDAGNLAGGRCAGQIGQNPDYVLRYNAGTLPLHIRASSSEDTTLVIRDPQGSWQCNDDANGLDPEVSFPRPSSGTYHIWVGTFSEAPAQARLEISEIASDGDHDQHAYEGDGPDMTLEAAFGTISLREGFPNDPHRVDILAGGSIPLSSVDAACPGMVSMAPDLELTYSTARGNAPLTFKFLSATDTVLLINAPDGEWYCDDDSDGNLDPRITFARPLDGVYDIWVGTIDGELYNGTLSITEMD